jgi:hypothetical protein
LSGKEIKEIPVVFGEADVLKVLQLKPGVKNGGEGTAGLFVRGGSPDQNLFILDEAAVYNPTHLFGIFSTFNADAISNVKLYKAGFPAEYGSKLSSVIEKENNITMDKTMKIINEIIPKSQNQYYTQIETLVKTFKEISRLLEMRKDNVLTYGETLSEFYEITAKIKEIEFSDEIFEDSFIQKLTEENLR